MIFPALLLASFLLAQTDPQKQQTEVRVNVIDVCTPDEEAQQQIADALSLIPEKPSFARDFEISRGRSTLPEAPVADWVRVQREFPDEAVLRNVQYTISVDEKSIIETLVFHVREQGSVLQMIMDDRVTAPASPEAVVASDTPARRIRIERFGQPSLVLARCPDVDQARYEPLFHQASRVLAHYRNTLDVRRIVPADLKRMGFSNGKKAVRKQSPEKP